MTKSTYEHLLQPGYIGKTRIKNRMVRMAAHPGFPEYEDGFLQPFYSDLWISFAKGGAGLIGCGVSPAPGVGWSLDTEEQIRAAWGIRAKRPLADATMARIAKGTMRYVVQAARPFLVRINHGDSRGRRDRGLDEPMPTATHHGAKWLPSSVTRWQARATMAWQCPLWEHSCPRHSQIST